MCRFLLIRSKKKFPPKEFLSAFSSMCENSRTTDGDRQSDGWGIAYKNLGQRPIRLWRKKWELYRSLNPIWDERYQFNIFPKTNILIAHARSAGFSSQIGTLKYNQPYIDNDICFVFNGMVRGVKLPYKLEGNIGAQKIFSYIQLLKKKNDLKYVLDIVHKSLITNSKSFEGMNIALTDSKKLYILCEYTGSPEYFTLHYYQDDDITLVCSEPILSYNWRDMKKGELLVF